MIDKYIEICRLISQKVVNEKDYSYIDQYFAEEYVYHGLGGMLAKSPQAFREAIKGFHAAIPDLKSEIIEIIGEGNTIVIHFNFTGTHEGELMGHAATGKALDFNGMIMRRFDKEKIAEDWDYFDYPSLVSQIDQ